MHKGKKALERAKAVEIRRRKIDKSLPGRCDKTGLNDLGFERPRIWTIQHGTEQIEHRGQKGRETSSTAQNDVQLLKVGEADGPEQGQH